MSVEPTHDARRRFSGHKIELNKVDSVRCRGCQQMKNSNLLRSGEKTICQNFARIGAMGMRSETQDCQHFRIGTVVAETVSRTTRHSVITVTATQHNSTAPAAHSSTHTSAQHDPLVSASQSFLLDINHSSIRTNSSVDIKHTTRINIIVSFRFNFRQLDPH